MHRRGVIRENRRVFKFASERERVAQAPNEKSQRADLLNHGLFIWNQAVSPGQLQAACPRAGEWLLRVNYLRMVNDSPG